MSVGQLPDLDNEKTFSLSDTDDEEESTPHSVAPAKTLVNNKDKINIKVAQHGVESQIRPSVLTETQEKETIKKILQETAREVKATKLVSYQQVEKVSPDFKLKDTPLVEDSAFHLKKKSPELESTESYKQQQSAFKQKWAQENGMSCKTISVQAQTPSDYNSITAEQSLQGPNADSKQNETTSHTNIFKIEGSTDSTPKLMFPEAAISSISSENQNLSTFFEEEVRKKFKASIFPYSDYRMQNSEPNSIQSQSLPVEKQSQSLNAVKPKSSSPFANLNLVNLRYPTDVGETGETVADDAKIVSTYLNFLRKEISGLSAKDFCDSLQTTSSSKNKGSLHETTLFRTLSSLKQKNNQDSPMMKELETYGTTSWELLQHIVLSFEEQFERSTFFDDEEFQQMSLTVQQTCSATFEKIHPDLQNTIENKIKSFINEYKEVNQEIRQDEEAIAIEILEHAIKYYAEEIEYFVNQKPFWDEKELAKTHQGIQCDTISNYSLAAEISIKDLKSKMESCLTDEIGRIYTRTRESNKKKAEIGANSKATASSSRAQELYKQYLSEIPYDPSNPEKFSSSEAQARSRAIEAFKNDTGGLLSHILSPIFNDLKKSLDFVYKQRIRENAEKRRNWESMLNHKAAEQEEAKSKLQSQSQSNSSLSSPTPQIDYPASNTREKTRSMEKEGVQPEKFTTWKPTGLKSLPNSTLCIHLGLHESIVATIYKDVAKIVRLYKNEVKLRNNKESHSLGGLLIKRPLDHPYTLKISKSISHSFRIEELLAIMIERWRNEAELVLLRRFGAVIIVVPQTLSRYQRFSVEDAARLAGFQSVELINDTHAMAIAHTLDDLMEDGKIVTATNFDGHVNAASFDVKNGVITVDNISGEFFLPTVDKSRLEKIIAYVLSPLSSQPPHKGYGNIFNDLKLKDFEKPKKVVSFGSYVDAALEDAFGKFDYKKSSEYAVYGAICLSSIEKEEGTAYHKFLQVTQNAISFTHWKKQLLQLHQDADERLKKTNDKGGANIGSKTLANMIANPIPWVKEERDLHEVKMDILQLIYNVELKILLFNDPHRKTPIKTHMDSYKAKLQNNPDLILLDLEKYKDEVLLILKNISV